MVFPGDQLTDKDVRCIEALSGTPGVTEVTVLGVSRAVGMVATLERLRALVERSVARNAVRTYGLNSVAGPAVRVPFPSAQSSESVAREARGKCVVNLSGVALPVADESTSVIELWWDGHRAEGLGAVRASGGPPRHIVVTRARGMGKPERVVDSNLTLTAGSEFGDRRNAASRSITLLARTLGGGATPISATSVTNNHVSEDPNVQSLTRVVSAATASLATMMSAVSRRTARQFWREDAWEILYRRKSVAQSPTPTLAATAFTAYRGGYARFFADPIPFSHDGVHAVFFEEYPYSLRRGIISAAVMQEDGTLSEPRMILERPYHLSYPFVFGHEGRVYMVPESSANRRVELYECVRFPFEWELRHTLLEGVAAVDATLHCDGARWWLFSTIGADGSYAWDELHIYSADSLTGNWIPHARNPVKCDATSARPAGPLFVHEGRLYRPTQDCSDSYGGAVNICEILTLTTEDFSERMVGRLDPSAFPGMDGLHTWAVSEGIEVIDVRPRRRYRWTAASV